MALVNNRTQSIAKLPAKSPTKSLNVVFLLISLILTSLFTGLAAHASSLWQEINPSSMAAYALKRPHPSNQTALATKETLYRVNWAALSSKLSKKSQQQAIQIPLPNGSTATYLFTYQPVMAEALAAKYPHILSFKAVDKNNPKNTGFFGISPTGFHGMFTHHGKRILIDSKGTHNNYMVYYATDAIAKYARQPDKFTFVSYLNRSTDTVPNSLRKALRRTIVNNQLTTYTIAFSAAAEYTAAVGGTKAAALAEINKMLTRVNGIYQRDLNIRFQLAEDSDKVIFTNANTDPFENNDNDIYKNSKVIKDAGLHDKIDLAHVLNTGAGGLAYNGVCDDDYKTRAVTGSPYPNSDVFYVSYVAHEIGHQLGAQHTFNGTTRACGANNRNANTAWEVLSGSSIMSYAGVCGVSENLATANRVGSSEFFHIGSIEEIKNYTAKKSCGAKQHVCNQSPVAHAGANHMIPAHTPFVLTGSGSDADNDNLTYIWEQKDVGSAANADTTPADDGKRPLFRSWETTSSTERYFPRFADVLANRLAKGENYATTNRWLNFQFTVRDGKGGVATDGTSMLVVNTGRAFKLIKPDVHTRWESNGKARIVWDVAGTDQFPISCHLVTINYSTDNGKTFHSLIENTANDGEQSVIVPQQLTDQARIQIICPSNVFYNVSQKFAITNKGSATGYDNTAVPAPAVFNYTPVSNPTSTSSFSTADGDCTAPAPSNPTTPSNGTPNNDTPNGDTPNNSTPSNPPNNSTPTTTSSGGSGGGSMPVYMLVLLFGGLLVSAGCQSVASKQLEEQQAAKQRDEQAKQQTARTAFVLENVIADVQQAVAMNDVSLYSMSGRNPVIPGVPIARRAYLENRCGVKFIAYGGDHIKSQKHGQLRKQAFDYAKAYNQIMLQYCEVDTFKIPPCGGMRDCHL